MIPQGFIDQINSQLGTDTCSRLVTALNEPPSVAVRLNPSKPASLPRELDGASVEWHAASRRLAARPQFTLMPELHAGGFYVQEPASMIVAHVVSRLTATGAPACMLDSCAAPGGKTTAARDALPEGSLLVANEFDPRRAQILAENAAKWGAPDIVVTQGDTSRLSGLHDTFDIILVDAPCSGEGMMRKEPEARSQWSAGLVRQCASLQREILDNVWPTLRPGGYLIYSTCTFNLDEDELQALYLIDTYGAESVAIDVDSAWGIGSSALSGVSALRFMPHITQSEGLFLTVLRKQGDYTPSVRKSSPKKKQPKRPAAPAALTSWLREPARFNIEKNGTGEWCALPTPYVPLIERLSSCTNVLQAGVPMAIEKGRDLVPLYQLALSTALNLQAFPRCEFSREQALDYLRREPVTLPPDTPRGYVLATCNGLPLGFLKNLGNRTNSLYPQQWRIRRL